MPEGSQFVPYINPVVDNIPLSSVRVLEPLLAELARANVPVIRLQIGQPRGLDQLEVVQTALRKASLGEYLYKDRIVLEAFRKGISNTYVDLFPPDAVLPTHGGSEAMDIMFYLLSGSSVLVFPPVYSTYLSVSAMHDVPLHSLIRKPDNGYSLPDKESIESMLSENSDIKTILAVSPDNPTGAVFSSEDIRVLLDIAVREDKLVIFDDAYRNIIFETGRHLSSIQDILIENPEYLNNVVILHSMSKEANACGLRVGALITTIPDLMAAAQRYTSARIATGTLGKQAAAALYNLPLEEQRQIFQTMALEYRQRRDIVQAALVSMGFQLVLPNGALYTFVDFRTHVNPKAHGIDALAFAEWLLTDYRDQQTGGTVSICPGYGFYPPGCEETGETSFRIAYVVGQEQLQEAMGVLGRAIQQYLAKI